MQVGWLDPSVDSSNTGDVIIAHAVEKELSRAGGSRVVRLPTQRRWTAAEFTEAETCAAFYVGGTNLLTSHPRLYRQWKIGPKEISVLRAKVVLLGVGWWQYQGPPDRYARRFLEQILDPHATHSVRDSYTQQQLSFLPHRVLNTTCPTLWDVEEQLSPGNRFRGVVISSVTDYDRDRKRDTAMLTTLRARCDQLFVWPQGSGDARYLSRLGFGGHLLDGTIDDFERVLAQPGAAYVGTRLHAGIRALQLGNAAVVVAVDNRATEIGHDVDLWVIERSDILNLDDCLDSKDESLLAIPNDEIDTWRTATRRSIAEIR